MLYFSMNNNNITDNLGASQILRMVSKSSAQMNEKVSENPEIVSTERSRKLIEKWGKVLEYTSKTELSTAILLEGQESWLSEEAKEKFLKKQKEKL